MQAAIYYKRSREPNYMMRSEKRPGYPNTRRKRPKKSKWYQILTIIMLILLCPVGLIMLWRKRLRWPNPLKLLATLLSLILLFLELGAALWYPFKDERIRDVQHTVSTAIGQAADAAGEFMKDVGANWDAVVSNGQEIGAAAGNHALGLFLDAIASPTPVPTQVPPMTLTRGEGSIDGIAAMMNRPTPSPSPSPTPTATPTPEPTETPAPTDTPEPTIAPSATANILERPTPSSDIPVFSLAPGVSDTPVPPVTPTPSPSATPIITPSPTPTIVPTIDPANIPKLQDIGDVPVWHTSNGQYYHKGPVCGSMSNAAEHTLASALAKNKKACPYCLAIEEKWARETRPVVYVSTDHYWHTRTGCESMTEEWSPMLLDDARVDRNSRPCDACGARFYVDGVPVTGTAASATVTPAPTTSQGLPQLTSAKEVTVWHTSNGQYYHKASVCGSMSNAREYTLAEAVKNGKKACPYCNPVGESLAGKDEYVVFAGSDSYWHTGTACKANTKEYSVVLLSEARTDDSLTPCTRCSADQYASGALPGQNSTAIQPESTEINDSLDLSKVKNGDVLVYYSGNTSHYHRRNRCASSTTTTFMPHTLMEALLENKIACPVCQPDEPLT
ncbi:MAG: hypothetical protein IJE08_10050 [Clostridia bacterium]|nr:hypothetical protein [Clostridia bacterium]